VSEGPERLRQIFTDTSDFSQVMRSCIIFRPFLAPAEATLKSGTGNMIRLASRKTAIASHKRSHYALSIPAMQKPRGAGAVDLLIAATALSRNLPLYTRNAAFRTLTNLMEIVAI
jgi:hypothetical protein